VLDLVFHGLSVSSNLASLSGLSLSIDSVLLASLLVARVDVEPLLRDRALVRVLGAAHVERHAVREDADLLVAQLLVADGAVVVFTDDQIRCFQLLLLLLGIEGLELCKVSCDLTILILGHLRVEERGQEAL